MTIDDLRARLRELELEAFLREYQGAFLLAMGFISVEAIRAGRRTAAAVKQEGRDATAAITFGARLRHDSMQKHPLAGCAFHLAPAAEQTTVMIGRSPDCAITIPDNGVSECHCRIEITAHGVTVVDAGSTNGTTVNLERLEPGRPKVLADEDILSVGRYSFQLLSARTFYDEISLLNELE